MSSTGALTLSAIAFALLGGLAAWLLNVPVWVIAIFFAVAGWLTGRAIRRFSRSRARQDTEGRT